MMAASHFLAALRYSCASLGDLVVWVTADAGALCARQTGRERAADQQRRGAMPMRTVVDAVTFAFAFISATPGPSRPWQ